MDSIYVYQQDGAECRACSDCDFEEKADFENLAKNPLANNAVKEELPTRVNNPDDPTREVEVQTIKLIDNN